VTGRVGVHRAASALVGQADRAEAGRKFLRRPGIADPDVEVDLLRVGGVGPARCRELGVLECQRRDPVVVAGDDDPVRVSSSRLGMSSSSA
jgi:hypothetical protein